MACICIVDKDLEMVAEQLDNKKYKYKFLCDSSEKCKSIAKYNLNMLNDCLVFSDIPIGNKTQKSEHEVYNFWKSAINEKVIERDRHKAIVSDYAENKDIVLVFPSIIKDYTRSTNPEIALNDTNTDAIIDIFINRLREVEGVMLVDYNTFTSDFYVDQDPDLVIFNTTQEGIKYRHDKDMRMKHKATFETQFKYRLITFYAKLKEFDLDEIMDILDRLGYCEELFSDGVLLYTDEVRKVLARRLCTISYQEDIQTLINKNILSKDIIPYNFKMTAKEVDEIFKR